MNYKLKLMIGFVLLSVILIVGCVEQSVIPKESNSIGVKIDTGPYFLDTLIVTFTGVNNGSVTASTYLEKFKKKSVNEEFKNLFTDNLRNFFIEKGNILTIEILNWHHLVNQTTIQIRYPEGLSDQEKDMLLKILKSELESEWYVQKVDFDFKNNLEGTKEGLNLDGV